MLAPAKPVTTTPVITAPASSTPSSNSGRLGEAGARVVLVEDVVTTGGSSLLAAERLRNHGFAVEHVIAIVDRQAGGFEAFAKEGLELHALFTRGDFPTSGP